MSASVTSLAGLRNVRAMLADAEPVPRARQIAPKPGEPMAGIGPGDWKGDALGLPPDCPVRPLGIQGNVAWFLDPLGQVQSMPPPYNRGQLLGVFLGQDYYLGWAWPKFGKNGADGFAAENAGPCLIRACAAKGPWKAIDKIRGRGNWIDGGGHLVTHLGKSVIAGGQVLAPGEHDGHVYPAAAKLPAPWLKRDEIPSGVVPLLRNVLRSWTWQRGEVDQHLLLGWIGAAFLGGALPWRPMIFVTGDKGTGKSMLQSLIKAVLGEWLVSAADATEAGVSSRLGLDCIGVAIDELEAETDNKKVSHLLGLARKASSGAVKLRGSADHKAHEFQARSAFLFSSINAPPLPPQDLSRMGLLRLQTLRPNTPPPEIDPVAFGMLGRAILSRIMMEWPRFHETFNAFAAELGRAGMDGRGQAQFGTLLTCADMIEHEGWDEARLAFADEAEGDLVAWSSLLRPGQMHEFEDQTENWRSCLSHLLGVRVEAWRGGKRHTVGQVALSYWDKRGDDPIDLVAANELLGQAGLRIVHKLVEGRPRYYLAVPNQSPLVRELFKDSHWQGAMGAAVWAAALRQGPKGQMWEAGQCRINGSQYKGTWLSLDGLFGEGGAMADEVVEDQA